MDPRKGTDTIRVESRGGAWPVGHRWRFRRFRPGRRRPSRTARPASSPSWFVLPRRTVTEDARRPRRRRRPQRSEPPRPGPGVGELGQVRGEGGVLEQASRRRSAPGQTRRPPPAGATTPAIASRSLLFEQIPSVFEQVASAALVTSSPGRGARQLARRRPCFPELQVELSGARRVAVAAAAVGEGSGGNRRRDSACVPRCATTSRCRRPRTPGVVGDSDEDGATLVSG